MARFGKNPLRLTEDLAYRLNCSAILQSNEPLLEFAVFLATMKRLNGIQFNPMTETFNLSRSAMAIRLIELNLVEI
jgi:hypothetical protein